MAEKNIDNVQSLIRYNNPVLVVKHADRKATGDAVSYRDRMQNFVEYIFV